MVQESGNNVRCAAKVAVSGVLRVLFTFLELNCRPVLKKH